MTQNKKGFFGLDFTKYYDTSSLIIYCLLEVTFIISIFFSYKQSEPIIMMVISICGCIFCGLMIYGILKYKRKTSLQHSGDVKQ